MDEFVSFSPKSKECVKTALLSKDLPVNTLIIGEKAVGKSELVKLISPNTAPYFLEDLEKKLINGELDLESISEVIILDIHKSTSCKYLIEQFEQKNIKIIATTTKINETLEEKFLVKIEVPPLKERFEDVEFLTNKYIKEAKKLFLVNEEFDNIDIDLSDNAISLKKSVFRAVLFNSLNKDDIMHILEEFLLKEFDNTTEYKELLKIFEIPLLKAGERAFKSQLQMANKFNINRNTLRKKLQALNSQPQAIDKKRD